MKISKENKRIIICSDGTWSKPEEDLKHDFPTNVLKVARGIDPIDKDGIKQVVFYDWGVGSYYNQIIGGAFGAGVNKNIKDCYRFILQNYSPGDQLFFFGFSRGAYTVRSLAGFIRNCGILKREHANRVVEAFKIYKSRNKHAHPDASKTMEFKRKYSHKGDIAIDFLGVWDTVGSLGIPLSFLEGVTGEDFFHDVRIGSHIKVARQALSIDELRGDFEPSLWEKKEGVDLKQEWFAGVHCDIGGGYKPDSGGILLADIPLGWMLDEASGFGLQFESHLSKNLKPSIMASKHNEYKGKYLLRAKHVRDIPANAVINESVKIRYQKDKKYRPKALVRYLEKIGQKW